MKLLRLASVSLILTFVTLVGGWIVEVLLAALHAALADVPALAFWPSVLIFIGAELVAVMFGEL